MNCHISALKKNTHWNSTMQNVWNKYQTFEYKILSSWDTRELAYQEEQNLLNVYFGKPFYMMQTSAAFGAPKGRISPMKGRKNTAEHIKKRADARRGKKMTDEQRMNVSIAHIKNQMTVLQYDINGLLIKEWDSIQELKNNFFMGNILRCCRGQRKSAYKYKWSFKNGA